MLREFRRIIILCAILILALNGFGQAGKTISASYEQTPFEQFVRDIESKTDYHFYYNAAELDSLSVTLNVSGKSLPFILQQVFQNTDFRYALDSRNRVFIARRFEILTSLPPGFFGKKRNPMDSIALAGRDYTDSAEEKEREKDAATAENKLYELGIKDQPVESW